MRHEPTIRKYFGGYESKDWSAVESCLAEGFTMRNTEFFRFEGERVNSVDVFLGRPQPA